MEKPATHDIWEGRKMVEAARKYQPHGADRHAKPFQPECHGGHQKLHEGVIGKLYMARGIAYKMRGNLGKHRPGPRPKG